MAITPLHFGSPPYDVPFNISNGDIDAIKLRNREDLPLSHEDLDENFANVSGKINAFLALNIDRLSIDINGIINPSANLSIKEGLTVTGNDIAHQPRPNPIPGFSTSDIIDTSFKFVNALDFDAFGHVNGYKEGTLSITANGGGLSATALNNVFALTSTAYIAGDHPSFADISLTGSSASVSMSTEAGADNAFLELAGGGSASNSRGAFIDLFGNQTSINPGDAVISSGTTGGVRVNSSQEISLTSETDLSLTSSSKVNISGDTDITGSLLVSGNLTVQGDTVTLNTQTLAVEDHTLNIAKAVDSSALTSSGLLWANDNKVSLLYTDGTGFSLNGGDLKVNSGLVHLLSDGSNGTHLSLENSSAAVTGVKFKNTVSSWTLSNDTNFRISDDNKGERLTVNPDGNVGIGVASPLDKLSITGGKICSGYDVSGSAQYGQLELQKSGVSDVDPNWSYLSFHRTSKIGWQQGIVDDNFTIGHSGGAASSNIANGHLTIDSSGRVGIGSSTLTSRLLVSGPNSDSLSLESQDSNGVNLNFSDSNGASRLSFYGENQTFTFGNTNSNVSGKRLHVDGGQTIGSGYDNSAAPEDGLSVEGELWVEGNIRTNGNIIGANISGGGTGINVPEVYGFSINSDKQLILTTTNQGTDDITAEQYASFFEVAFSITGFSFHINNAGDLIAQN